MDFAWNFKNRVGPELEILKLVNSGTREMSLLPRFPKKTIAYSKRSHRELSRAYLESVRLEFFIAKLFYKCQQKSWNFPKNQDFSRKPSFPKNFAMAPSGAMKLPDDTQVIRGRGGARNPLLWTHNHPQCCPKHPTALSRPYRRSARPHVSLEKLPRAATTCHRLPRDRQNL